MAYLPELAGVLPVVVAEDGDVELGVVVSCPAAFIEVVVSGEVFVAAAVVEVSLGAVPEEGVPMVLDEGDDVSVDAVVVEGVVVVVVVVVEPGIALAPELLYAELGLLHPPRAAARATARTQGIMRFMLSPDFEWDGGASSRCTTRASGGQGQGGARARRRPDFLSAGGKSFRTLRGTTRRPRC
jgi:hypothetical protein